MIVTFEGRREPLRYSDWRKLGWDKQQAKRFELENEPGGPNEIRQAFLYCSGEHIERERMAVNVMVPTEAGQVPATRRDEYAFEWGYEGSGPHATARAILGQLLLEEPVPWVSQQFKRDVIGRQHDEFSIDTADIGGWADWVIANSPPPDSYPQATSQLEALSRLGRRARKAART